VGRYGGRLASENIEEFQMSPSLIRIQTSCVLHFQKVGEGFFAPKRFR